MNMPDVIELVSPDTIRIERLLHAPIDSVWQWLVDPELRARWFAGGTTDARPGGSIVLHFDHDNLSSTDVAYPPRFAGSKGHEAVETIETYDPPHRLSFGWGDGKEGLVTITLAAEDKLTRLVLIHSAISGAPAMINFGGGWTSHLAVLEALLDGHDIPDFWALHSKCEGAVARLLGDAGLE